MYSIHEFKDRHYSKEEKDSADLTLYAAGYQDLEPQNQYGPIVRSYHVIHFVFKGKGTLHIHQRTFPVHAGQAFLIPAHELSWYRADDKDPWSYCWLSFLGLHSSRYMSALQEAARDGYVLSDLDPFPFLERIKDFVEHPSQGIAAYFYSSALLCDILGLLFEKYQSINIRPKTDNPAENLKYLIDMNIGKKIHLQKAARELGYHPNYLSRKFSETYGCSPKQYIETVKMRKARTMIEKGTDSISLIAESLGFSDLASFSKMFRSYFKASPSSFHLAETKKKAEDEKGK